MNAPMTPPSNRIVRPGHRVRCASVAASSGMPTPANTTCPSLSCRALRIARSSAADTAGGALSVVNGPPRASGREQLIQADQIEKRRPRLRAVDVAIEILAHAVHWIAVGQAHVVLHVPEHRLVDAVALVRRRPERQLDDR